jgi:hypothetical protein
LAPAAGYELSEVAGTCGGSLSGRVFTTDPVIQDCTVEVVYDEELTGGLPIWLLYEASK